MWIGETYVGEAFKIFKDGDDKQSQKLYQSICQS